MPKAFTIEMRSRTRELSANAAIFRHYWQAWNVWWPILCTSAPKDPLHCGCTCSLIFLGAFVWSFNEMKKLAELIVMSSGPQFASPKFDSVWAKRHKTCHEAILFCSGGFAWDFTRSDFGSCWTKPVKVQIWLCGFSFKFSCLHLPQMALPLCLFPLPKEHLQFTHQLRNGPLGTSLFFSKWDFLK